MRPVLRAGFYKTPVVATSEKAPAKLLSPSRPPTDPQSEPVTRRISARRCRIASSTASPDFLISNLLIVTAESPRTTALIPGTSDSVTCPPARNMDCITRRKVTSKLQRAVRCLAASNEGSFTFDSENPSENSCSLKARARRETGNGHEQKDERQDW